MHDSGACPEGMHYEIVNCTHKISDMADRFQGKIGICPIACVFRQPRPFKGQLYHDKLSKCVGAVKNLQSLLQRY